MENIYHIGFGVDANYAKYAGVLMTNIVLTHLGQPIYFHIVCDGLYEEDKRRFENFSLLYRNVKIVFYDAVTILNSLNPISKKAPSRLHRAVLLRILLPYLVADDIKRVIYMDVDMLCLKRLDELWNMDMQGNIVAAAMHHSHTRKSKSLNLSKDRFLSAGLMLIDVVAWKNNNITQRVFQCYQKNSEKFLAIEEDALNTVLDGEFLDIGDRFNFCIEVNNPLNSVIDKDTVVLHFFEESKPWTKGCIPEIHKLYWKYVHLSLWNDMEMKEPTTVKAVFLAGVTEELKKNYKEAKKYYGATSKRLIEYYVEKNRYEIFNEEITLTD
jgi:lipopolysaccharide biosynthesis glycosyltransferase